MSLADVPLILLLVGLAAYAVLGGADFGAGFWQLWGGRGERDRALREHAHHAMGPVWETNHVWLVFVLVICWTAYPTAFASIASTLSVPLFIAAIGIILRGTAYALRSGTRTLREQRRIEVAFAISSILTPFALGAVIGGIASGRVPVGNAKGDLLTSWLNATSIFIGVLAVATAAYLAAVYLAADAVRVGRSDLADAFRARALGSGVVAGALALAGLPIVRDDAPRIWDGLTGGDGRSAVIASGLAGVATLALVLRRRFAPARVTAALAVAAIVAGWALAQRPDVLPGLTVEEAAASHSALVAVIVGVAIGAIVLVPSLALLFGLVLRGRFDPQVVEPEATSALANGAAGIEPLLGVAASVCLAVGGTLTFFFETSWAHIIGVSALLAFVGLGFVALAAIVVSHDEPD
ncbi:MAG TPA: cytochrome d ubiquinol oxidase subunit II [Gaiellaceae bacterium]